MISTSPMAATAPTTAKKTCRFHGLAKTTSP
jgi:hypothetical protein